MRTSTIALVLIVASTGTPLLAGEAPVLDETAKTDAQRQIEEALQKRVSLNFADTPVTDATAFLRNVTGVTFVVDDVRGDALPVTFRCQEMKLGLILKLMLKRAELGHRVESSAIYIAAPERIAEVAKLEKGVSLDTPLTKEALAKPMSLNFADTPMRDVCNFLSDVTRLNILLDAKHDPELTFKARAIPARDCLIYISRLIRLRVYAEDNVVVFTDEPKSEKE